MIHYVDMNHQSVFVVVVFALKKNNRVKITFYKKKILNYSYHPGTFIGSSQKKVLGLKTKPFGQPPSLGCPLFKHM